MNLSVRFFKRLFLGILVALIVIPMITSICFGISVGRSKKQIAQLENQLEAAGVMLPESGDEAAASGTDEALGQDEVPTETDFDLAYQSLYPELYCENYRPQDWSREQYTAYLTFDDGPSANTEEILEILRKADIKATFFVTGRGDASKAELLKKIADEGHTIGIHTYTHEYKNIYASVEAYLDDFNLMYQMVYEATGVKPELFRFPGGSINGYNGALYQPLIAEMTRRGFTYFDWNVSGADARVGATAESITKATLEGLANSYRSIVLLHDAADKDETVRALPAIISGIQQQGFSFAPLTAKTKPIAFGYSD